jgi:hypothetical protein
MTSCSGLDSPYKYYLVVQSDLMHNLNFSNLGFTQPINTCCNFGHVTMHVVCGTHWRQKLQRLKNLCTIPLACIELLHWQMPQLQTMVDAITYVIAFWYHISVTTSFNFELTWVLQAMCISICPASSSSFLASLFYICPFCWHPEKFLE